MHLPRPRIDSDAKRLDACYSRFFEMVLGEGNQVLGGGLAQPHPQQTRPRKKQRCLLGHQEHLPCPHLLAVRLHGRGSCSPIADHDQPCHAVKFGQVRPPQ